MDRRAFQIRLPESLRERLERYRTERGISQNAVVTLAIEEYLNRHAPVVAKPSRPEVSA